MCPAPMSPASFASLLKSSVRKHAVFVPDQPIGLDPGGIEVHLDLHILGDGDERAAHLLHQHLAGFRDVVDVGVVAVALIRELLERRVLVVAHAEAEHAEEHATLCSLFDQAREIALIGDADVEVAVGHQDDAIDAAA